jgi:hypothetical protein
MKIRILIALVLLLAAANFAFAQTTEFTYQGRLVDGAMPANASYDFEFKLFDVETGGTELGTQTRLGVPVSNGIFTVLLDFASRFPGAARWIEIAVKPAGGPSYTTLNPRQRVSSAPYSIQSLNANTAGTANNALNLGGVAANQFVVTTDPRMTDARDPLPGSVRYVQNGLAQQAASNFNITGDGTAGGTLSGNAVNSTTQYNIGGIRVLTTSSFSGNIFAGNGAGASNGSGGGNSFFGNQAGQLNVTGGNNSFFGKSAGNLNTAGNNSFFGEQSGFGNSTGANNSFFGQASGRNNSTASDNAFFGFRAGFNNTANGNSFFGSQAGDSVTSGAANAFFGKSAGAAVITSFNNSFFGYNAGAVNTASNNSFFGARAGDSNTSGSSNAFFGEEAGQANVSGDNNSFFGTFAGAFSTASGNSFFGRNAGLVNTTGANNTFVGNGAGDSNSSGGNNVFVGNGAGSSNITGTNHTFIGNGAGSSNTTGNNNTLIGNGTSVGDFLQFSTAIGAGAQAINDNEIRIGRTGGLDGVIIPGDLYVGGTVRVNNLSSPGSVNVCRNTAGELSTCSSSLRYKNNIQNFTNGLNTVRRLRPITFNWKDGGMKDVGFAAEEVEKIEPLLTTYNNKGEIEGVKYAQITPVLVNAVKEQQQTIEQQQRQIDALKKLVCLSHPQADVCKEK